MAKHKKEQAKAAKASDSSRPYIAAAVFAAVLGAFAAGVIDLSAAQPEKAPAAVMERPPRVERATAKSKAASSDPADVRAQPEAAADGKRDKNPSCATWAAGGECTNNPAFMASDCAASCRGMLPEQSEPVAVAGGQAEPKASLEPEAEGLTNLWPAPQLPPELERAQAESDALGPRPESLILQGPKACVDLRDDCGSLARHNLSGCGEAPVMLTDCRKTCKLCRHLKVVDEVVGECADKNPECGRWAKMGECSKNKRFMLSSCSRACEVCDEKRNGCSRRNATAGLVAGEGEGSLAEMFRLALTDFPQWSPTALSIDPPIVQFEDLLSEAEAEAVVDRCRNFGKFERSQAGDQISTVRTSTQCWCDDNDDCLANPAVRALTDRMMNVTRLPYNNAEYFQILQYHEGQFYKTHHDQQTAFWTPQGVRVYTFFVYLSDVEQGGGTRFTDLGITVTPKRGRGILWPSVLTNDLNAGDMRTHHEALAVEKGVKHAANLWQHLYDFKTPSRSGLCPFLGQNTNP